MYQVQLFKKILLVMGFISSSLAFSADHTLIDWSIVGLPSDQRCVLTPCEDSNNPECVQQQATWGVLSSELPFSANGIVRENITGFTFSGMGSVNHVAEMSPNGIDWETLAPNCQAGEIYQVADVRLEKILQLIILAKMPNGNLVLVKDHELSGGIQMYPLEAECNQDPDGVSPNQILSISYNFNANEYVSLDYNQIPAAATGLVVKLMNTGARWWGMSWDNGYASVNCGIDPWAPNSANAVLHTN